MMRIYTFQSEQTVPCARPDVFAFFSRPENLQQLTPAHLHFRILTPSPVPMGVGTLIDYALRIWGMPVHWRTLITHFDPPHSFVDQQIKGPYALWHHRHTFDDTGTGTRILDQVHYALPLGGLGQAVHWAYVRRDLERIFAYRRRIIADLFRPNWTPPHVADAPRVPGSMNPSW